MNRLSYLVFSTLLPVFLGAQAQTSSETHEETVVRTAYAKLAYLTELSVYSKAAIASSGGEATDSTTMSERVQRSVVNYELDNFKTGPLSEIANEAWGDVISAPLDSDSIIRVTVGSQHFIDDGLPETDWKTAEAKWAQAAPVADAARSKILAMKVQQVLDLGGMLFTYPDVVYDRYASFQVRVIFQGKIIGPYRALFFFGKNKKGLEVAAPQDLYSDVTSIFRATSESFYPAGLLHTHLREIPVLADWLNASQISAQMCSQGAGELCCSTSRCGISQTDLQRELSVPLRSTLPGHSN